MSGRERLWCACSAAAGCATSCCPQEKLDAEGASIHFHNWQFEGFLELVLHCQDALNLPIRLEHAQMNGAEFLLVMRRTRASLASA